MAGRYAETLGQYLKRERESRSVSLEELSKSTRISLPILEALEKDDFEPISHREFVLGFLRGYARQLGLNPEEVLRRYRIQSDLAGRKEKFQQIPLFPGAGPREEEGEDPAPQLPDMTPLRQKKKIPWKILLQIAVVLAALGTSFYLHQTLKKSEVNPNPISGKILPGKD